MYRYLRKPKMMKVYTFTTRLIQLNNYLPYFPPECVGPIAITQTDSKVKEILYHTMPDRQRKKVTKQGYNFLDRSI